MWICNNHNFIYDHRMDLYCTNKGSCGLQGLSEQLCDMTAFHDSCGYMDTICCCIDLSI